MSSLTNYNGLSVLTPEPTADGGKAINDNFKALSTPLETTDPGSSDDSDSGFSVGSRWFNATSSVEWICTDDAVGAATWQVVASPSQWTAGSSAIYYNGGNIGIGTSTPSNRISVYTGSDVGDLLSLKYLLTYLHFNTYDASYSQEATIKSNTIPGLSIIEENYSPISFYTNSTKRATITATGSFGIGTTSPGTLLDVDGDASANTFVAKPQSSAPSSPTAGQVYFNNSDSHFYGWNGTAWVQLDN